MKYRVSATLATHDGYYQARIVRDLTAAEAADAARLWEGEDKIPERYQGVTVAECDEDIAQIICDALNAHEAKQQEKGSEVES